MKQLVTPHVNLNGNEGMQLVNMALEIKRAILEAENTIMKNFDLGHGRNFTGDHDCCEAREALFERVRVLHAMATEFEDLGFNIHRQIGKY
jgi:hypothetical protein